MRIEVISCPPIDFPEQFNNFVSELRESENERKTRSEIPFNFREVVTDIFHDGYYHYITLSERG